MIDAQKKAYELAADSSKQLVTLASALLVFAATFVRDRGPSPILLGVIVGSYIALFAALLFGMRVLFLLTAILGGVESNSEEGTPPLIKNKSVQRAATWQSRFFAVGVGLLAIFGFCQIW